MPQEIDPVINAYYSARAAEYERIYLKPERQTELRELEVLLPSLVSGKRVLEVACGTGYWTRFLCRSAAHVVATDYSLETLALARAKQLPREQVRFMRADAYALQPELGSFNAAVACFWWSHVPSLSRDRFFASLHKRLEPGARVLLVDNLFVNGSSTPISRTDEQGNTYQSRALENGDKYEVLKNFPTEELLLRETSTFANNATYRILEYYWVFWYELAA